MQEFTTEIKVGKAGVSARRRMVAFAKIVVFRGCYFGGEGEEKGGGERGGMRGNGTFGCMDASMAESTNAGGSCEKKVERQKAPACGLPALLRHVSVGSRTARLLRQR
jgi:hypothetical protein